MWWIDSGQLASVTEWFWLIMSSFTEGTIFLHGKLFSAHFPCVLSLWRHDWSGLKSETCPCLDAQTTVAPSREGQGQLGEKTFHTAAQSVHWLLSVANTTSGAPVWLLFRQLTDRSFFSSVASALGLSRREASNMRQLKSRSLDAPCKRTWCCLKDPNLQFPFLFANELRHLGTSLEGKSGFFRMAQGDMLSTSALVFISSCTWRESGTSAKGTLSTITWKAGREWRHHCSWNVLLVQHQWTKKGWAFCS